MLFQLMDEEASHDVDEESEGSENDDDSDEQAQ